MKKLTSIILVMVLLVVLSAALVQAQDEEEAEASGSFTQYAVSGTFTDNEDGTFTLTLDGIGENSAWVLSAPVISAGLTPNIMYDNVWNAIPDGMEASGVITTGDYLLLLTVSSPVYGMDSGSMSYVVVIDEIVYRGSEELKGDPEAPESFDEAAMFILIDNAFLENWAAGSNAQLEGARPGGASSCSSSDPNCR